MVEADLAVEDFCESVFAFVAFQVQSGHTARAVRRLMPSNRSDESEVIDEGNT